MREVQIRHAADNVLALSISVLKAERLVCCHAYLASSNSGNSSTSNVSRLFEYKNDWNKLVTLGSELEKFLKEEQRYQAYLQSLAVGNGVLNDSNPLFCHALLKFTPVASVPSFAPAGND